MLPANVLERIEKLINLQNNAAATPGEVANCSAAIQNILNKYSLEMSDIQEHIDGLDPNNIIEESFEMNLANKKNISWHRALMVIICKYNFCKCIVMMTGQRGISTNSINIIGKRHNIEIVKYFYDYLCGRIVIAARNAAWEDKVYSRAKTWANDFAIGVIKEVDIRMAVMRKMSYSDEQSTDLIKKEMAKVDLEFANLHPHTRNISTAKRRINERAVNRGKEFGKNIPLNDALNSGGSAIKLIEG